MGTSVHRPEMGQYHPGSDKDLGDTSENSAFNLDLKHVQYLRAAVTFSESPAERRRLMNSDKEVFLKGHRGSLKRLTDERLIQEVNNAGPETWYSNVYRAIAILEELQSRGLIQPESNN